jgi:hypothetical protein
MQGHANRKGTIDHVYLPISMGYRYCYKRYMLSLGLKTRCAPEGAIIVDGVDSGKPSDHGYVSFSAYYCKWRMAYPQLKVSRPAEDICGYCFVFVNRHRYLANHSAVAVADCSDDDEDEDDDDAAPPDEEAAVETEEAAVIEPEEEAAAETEEAAVIEEQLPAGCVGEQLLVNMSEISLDSPEAAATQAEEARELLLIESAKGPSELYIRHVWKRPCAMRLWSIPSERIHLLLITGRTWRSRCLMTSNRALHITTAQWVCITWEL